MRNNLDLAHGHINMAIQCLSEVTDIELIETMDLLIDAQAEILRTIIDEARQPNVVYIREVVR